MTKKAYIIPETQEIKIQAQQILAGSTPELTVNGNDEDGVDDEKALLSRRHFNLWDED